MKNLIFKGVEFVETEIGLISIKLALKQDPDFIKKLIRLEKDKHELRELKKKNQILCQLDTDSI